MREIKFRGKDIHTKEWRYGFYFVEYKQLDEEGNIDAFHYITDAMSTWEIDYKTIGQFTNSTAENGIEIYEGDILPVTYSTGYSEPTVNCIVKFGEICSQNKFGDDQCYQGFFLEQFSSPQNEFQINEGKNIIGNIYQNQDLLKENQL